MAGEIKHRWDGTVLTITSDSGTSSCDLKGKQGDRGVRGAQGRAGVILNSDGTINMDGYATEAYVLDAIDVALEDYTPSGGGGGTGGGGSSNNAVMTLTSTTGWTYKTISSSGTCVITGKWSSIENEMETGGGTLSITVGGLAKATKNVKQGEFEVDVTEYLLSGSNTVKIKITDIYGNSRSLAFTINKVSLTLTSTFDATVHYETAINFPYTPVGSVDKTMHFILDGIEIGSNPVITTSGRQYTFPIPQQTHGSHTFEVYFTAEIEGEEVESNHLYYDIICVVEYNSDTIISCAFNKKEMVQYQTVNIPYIVYNPLSLTSDVSLIVNGEVVSTLTVDRTQQTWAFRADTYGEITLVIASADKQKEFKITATETTIKVDATTENLELFLTSYGRSNQETNPNQWKYGDIECQFSGYNWISDGWLLDDDGITVHRVSGDARLTIPLKMFENDFRTTGKTIEFEFATRNVMNYDAEIVSCFSNNIGFKMTAQKAILKSEQSELFTQYKDDEHIRLTFVIEKRADNRLIFIYLNGIMCGATQYPDDDDFSQGTPVNITIGSNECTIDLYNIRVYNNNLTRYQVLDNWIADTQNVEERIDRFARNNVFDSYGNIVIENLPSNLPYMILTAAQLPQYKGNKLTVAGEYVDVNNGRMSFTFDDAQADVQGTSSAGYARKNYKIKFKNGITQNGTKKDTYQMRDGCIPTDTFTFKADVASSEGANNVELVRLYDRICPFRTPPQLTNSAVRQGIDGFPIVIFHNDGTDTTFIGKYNFNNDKGTPEVFGMDENDESWEIRNNTSDRVVWKNDDFSGTDWLNDFEARHPEDNTDTTNLQRFSSWVKSTDRTAATGATLSETKIYEGVSYAQDTADYRLAKFKDEIGLYADLESSLFYYLFTELFLMVDSRAKNAFPTIYDRTGKVCWLPYDMDTAIGINNEGDLVFGYELEDIDKTETGADVYNGQNSVFWCNIRDAFKDELKTMYQELRSDGGLSYEDIENAYEEHQSVWCEAIWNEDAYYKYLEPLINDGASIYLPMLQGSKSEQRKWWLYNRFRYIDSKYNAGDANKDFITLRGYAKSDITVTPYADIYATIKYGSYLVQERALRGSYYTLACPLDNVNDTEIYIYSASQLKSIGDVSGLKVGLADFSMATKLQNVKVGDSSSSYSNENLVSLTLGNNTLLNTIDARNCVNFGTGEQQSLDVSGCTNVEHIYLTGTALKGIKLPNGGILKTLHLPDTITNLTLINQTALRDFKLNDYSNISTLRLENVEDIIDGAKVVNAMADGGRVRIVGVNWNIMKVRDCENFFTKLQSMRGLDENGNNVNYAVISGTISIPYTCQKYLDEWQALYPQVNFIVRELTLEEHTWDEIMEICNQGKAAEMFKVGDRKEVELTNGKYVDVIIYGFNHDNLADGSGKASITFGMENASESTASSGSFYSISDKLPEDLKSKVKQVIKSKQNANSDGKSIGTATYTYWAFSISEILGVNTYYGVSSSDGSLIGGEQYEYFKKAPVPSGLNETLDDTGMGTGRCTTGSVPYTTQFGEEISIGQNKWFNSRSIKGAGEEPTAAVTYWLRDTYSYSTTYSTYSYHTYCMSNTGTVTSALNYTYYYNSSSSTHGYRNFCFGFCI